MNKELKNKISYFNKYGFVILRKVITKKNINDLFREIDNVKLKAIRTRNKRFYHLTKDKKINTIHNIQKFCRSKILTSLSRNSHIKKFVNKFLTKNNIVRNYEFFLKPAKTGMSSPMHQDNYFWNISDSKALNSWIALSNANKKNGGLFYLIGSHKLGTVKHVISYKKGTSQMIKNKEIGNFKLKKFYPNLKKGDCLLHHCQVIHGSDQNLSKHDRIGIAISFKNKNSKIDVNKQKKYEKELQKNLKKLEQINR